MREYEEFEAIERALRTWSATGHFAFHEVDADDHPDFFFAWQSPEDPDFPPMLKADRQIVGYADREVLVRDGLLAGGVAMPV